MLNNTIKNQGLAVFNFQRKNKKSITDEMIGFSSDVFSGKKIKSFEWKLGDEDSKRDIIEIVDLAKKYYRVNMDIIVRT